MELLDFATLFAQTHPKDWGPCTSKNPLTDCSSGFGERWHPSGIGIRQSGAQFLLYSIDGANWKGFAVGLLSSGGDMAKLQARFDLSKALSVSNAVERWLLQNGFCGTWRIAWPLNDQTLSNVEVLSATDDHTTDLPVALCQKIIDLGDLFVPNCTPLICARMFIQQHFFVNLPRSQHARLGRLQDLLS